MLCKQLVTHGADRDMMPMALGLGRTTLATVARLPWLALACAVLTEVKAHA